MGQKSRDQGSENRGADVRGHDRNSGGVTGCQLDNGTVSFCTRGRIVLGNIGCGPARDREHRDCGGRVIVLFLNYDKETEYE